MTKHTPGPWYDEKHTNGKTYVYPKSGINPICEVFEGYAQNLDLIAAAPETAAERDKLKAINAELLEQLQEARGYIVPESERGNAFAQMRLNMIDAVIHKAKGE